MQFSKAACLFIVSATVACSGAATSTVDGPVAIVDGPVATAMPILPTSTGTCPTLVNGDVTFAPAGMTPRKVKLALNPAATTNRGSLLIYWHATGSSPMEAAYALGPTQTAILAAGGVVATPYSDDTAGQFEWFIVNQSAKQDDFFLADEIVACLHAAQRIDPAHIHSMGMSAGALQTTAFSFVRSNYIASVATYSGGTPNGFNPTAQAPQNKFAALIFDGGVSDNVFGIDFQAASAAFATKLKSAGHFAPRCNHGKGHEIPLDAAPSVAAFFEANGFGAWPSPYRNGLPASFPSYCAL